MAQLKVIVNRLNRRQTPVDDFSLKENITGVVYKGFQFLSVDEDENKLGKWYKDFDGNYYWGGGLTTVTVDAPALQLNSRPIEKARIELPRVEPKDLPLTRSKCLSTADWLELHFGKECENAVAGTPFTKELLYAIACQETAIYFYGWTRDFSPGEVLARCVFDASGDVNATRKAFPRNTAAFIAKYGKQKADFLIEESNKTRKMRGFSPKQWVYAGYGIFQYDLQHIVNDEAFFFEKQWYEMKYCLDRLMKELNGKWLRHTGDLFATVKAYNGSGERAENYANHVLQFLDWIRKGK